jgi:hypothetical protein
MANRPALAALSSFVSQQTAYNASLLVHIPSIYDVLQYHQNNSEPYPTELISLCKWIHERGQGVLEGLIVHQPPPVDKAIDQNNVDWHKVRDFYASFSSA